MSRVTELATRRTSCSTAATIAPSRSAIVIRARSRGRRPSVAVSPRPTSRTESALRTTTRGRVTEDPRHLVGRVEAVSAAPSSIDIPLDAAETLLLRRLIDSDQTRSRAMAP